LAVQAGIPIIPVVCENYWRLYHKGVFESGTLRLKVLPPVPTTGLTTSDVVELSSRVREMMLGVLREISTPVAAEEEEAEVPPVLQAPSTPTTERQSNTRSELSKASMETAEMKLEGSRQVAPEGERGAGSRLQEGSETSSVSGDQTEDEWKLVDTPPAP